MLEQIYPFKPAAQAGLVECYYDGALGKWIGVQEADFRQLPAAAADKNKVLKSPRGIVRQLSAGFTMPAKMLMAHAKNADSIAQLASMGVERLRLRDTGTTWMETVFKYAAITNTAAADNKISWAAHGADPATHAFAWYSTSSSPSGLTASKLYYIVNATTDSFQLALTPLGAPINLGTVGSELMGILINMSVMHPDGASGKLDLLVTAAGVAGMEIVYDASKLPPGITSDGTPYHRPTTHPYAKTASTYVTRWYKLLSDRYTGKITHVQTGNEAQDAAQWHGSISGAGNDLLTYVGSWFDAIAYYVGQGTGTPMKVLSPSWNVDAGVAAMSTWLTEGAAKVDIVCFHPYRNGSGWLGADIALMEQYVAAAKAKAPTKEVWVAEVGTHTPTPEELARFHYAAAALGVKCVGWYSFDLAAGVYTGVTPEEGYDMRLVNNAGCADAYFALAARQGQAFGYCNLDRRSGRIAIGGGAESEVY